MKDLNGRDPLEDQTFDETQNAPSRTKVWLSELESMGWRYRAVIGHFHHSNETSDSIKGGKLLYQPSDCHVHKKGFVSRS
jgi:hypothetical protein